MAAVYRLVRRVTVRMRLALVARYARRVPGRLLDVGCGTGEFLAHAHTKGWSVVGVEPGVQAAAEAERLGLDIRRVRALDIPRDSPFDAITMWHALEHMHDPASQLERAAALLASEGCLVVAVPNHRCVDADAYGPAWYAWDVPRHLWHFDVDSLGALLAMRGFVVAGVHAMPLDPFYIALQSEFRVDGGRNVVRAATIATRSALAARRDPSRACGIAVVARRG
jgi:SAM-dependent methyltransferase